MANFANHLLQLNKKVLIFSGKRHQEELINETQTLTQYLDTLGLKCIDPENINTDPVFLKAGSDNSLAFGFGETWRFDKKSVDLYAGRLIDFMGIKLPEFRGGAHYTWQILCNNKESASMLQLINEEMIQGKFDSGEILLSKPFYFSSGARIPKDYFIEANARHLDFLKEFVRLVDSKKKFCPKPINEEESIFFGRLYTNKNAFIDWSWDTQEIERFICAFDDPYPGASTFINGKRVWLKDCHISKEEKQFHPYQSGLIIRIHNKQAFVSTNNGILFLSWIGDDNGDNILDQLAVGSRFFTPEHILEKSMLFSPDYDSKGLIESD